MYQKRRSEDEEYYKERATFILVTRIPPAYDPSTGEWVHYYDQMTMVELQAWQRAVKDLYKNRG